MSPFKSGRGGEIIETADTGTPARHLELGNSLWVFLEGDFSGYVLRPKNMCINPSPSSMEEEGGEQGSVGVRFAQGPQCFLARPASA